MTQISFPAAKRRWSPTWEGERKKGGGEERAKEVSERTYKWNEMLERDRRGLGWEKEKAEDDSSRR